jgi:hypothetical protein
MLAPMSYAPHGRRAVITALAAAPLEHRGALVIKST